LTFKFSFSSSYLFSPLQILSVSPKLYYFPSTSLTYFSVLLDLPAHLLPSGPLLGLCSPFSKVKHISFPKQYVGNGCQS
jgi:hypothetical protein